MYQVKILKLVIKQENQKTPQKRQSYNLFKRKHTKKALVNRKGLKNIDRTSIGLEKSHDIFINENLSPANNNTAFHCPELKGNGRIDKTY